MITSFYDERNNNKEGLNSVKTLYDCVYSPANPFGKKVSLIMLLLCIKSPINKKSLNLKIT
jgi:hypothetical protein